MKVTLPEMDVSVPGEVLGTLTSSTPFTGGSLVCMTGNEELPLLSIGMLIWIEGFPNAALIMH